MWLALVLGTGALLAFLAWRFPDALYAERDRVRLVYLVLLLVLVSSSILAGRRLRLRGVAKAAGLWALIIVVLALGITYRLEIGAIGARVLGEFLPHRGTVLGAGEVRFPVGADGHFRVEALVDGTPTRFLVDTGASGIVLSLADARRLGFDPASFVSQGSRKPPTAPCARPRCGSARSRSARSGSTTCRPRSIRRQCAARCSV